jgi:hypothetical protein
MIESDYGGPSRPSQIVSYGYVTNFTSNHARGGAGAAQRKQFAMIQYI